MEAREEYKGFILSWQEPPIMGNMWQVTLCTDSWNLSAYLGSSGSIIFSGRDYDDAKTKARNHVDGFSIHRA